MHSIWLDAFWIDQTEVTNAMYAKCVTEEICKSSEYSHDYRAIGAGHPVVGVGWNNASP
jgi:formylglycine-generating enzyme required for sulfatase activity